MSTAFFDAEKEIRDRLVANWASTTNIVQYDNQKVTPVPSEPYIEFKIIFDEHFQASIGSEASNVQRVTGLVYFKILVPSNQGTKEMREIMDVITTLFKNKTFGSILTFEVNSGIEVTSANGNWYEKMVTIPFIYQYNGV